MSFAVDFALRLMKTAPRLPEDQRARHSTWLLSEAVADGAFRGRSDLADLYYTAFGVRCALVLGCLDVPFLEKMRPFLQQQTHQKLTVVDLASFLNIAFLADLFGGVAIDDRSPQERQNWALQILNLYRRPDGGWAKSSKSSQSSTYHTFLALGCLELLDVPAPEPQRILAMLLQRQASDGGFVDLPFLRESGTNPTAAALAVLSDLNVLDDSISQKASSFLRSMQRTDGGFAAAAQAPCSDLLSTVTAIVSLDLLNSLDAPTAKAAKQYVTGLEHSDGGYRSVILDDQRDVEYTFYGLAATAWLAEAPPQAP